MASSIICSSDGFIHSVIMPVSMMSGTIGADRMVVMMPIAMVPIYVGCHAVVRVPPSRPIVPIVWRVPTYPIGTPEPIIDVRAIDIDRFDDVVGPVDILVANDLYSDVFCFRVFFHIDRSHILIDILSQDRLNDHEVLRGICRFNDS